MVNYFENAKNHFITITEHRHEVIRNCFRAGIGFQGLFHDLSKYTPTEFIPGILYFQGNRSPNEKERETSGYSKAWLHHKGRNKHHYEYWNDYNPVTKKLEPVRMPYRYFTEMVCDRVAASKIYYKDSYTDDASLKYYLGGNTNKRLIHPDTAAELLKVLRILAKYGENRMFSYLRKQLRNERCNSSQKFVNKWMR